jgi:CRP/FNR family transcriptional regulator
MSNFKIEYFKKVFPALGNTSNSLVNDVFSRSRYQILPSKMVVKLEGEKCQDFVFMLSGGKRIYKISSSSRDVTLYEIASGDICILNASCILSDSRLPASAATTADTEVLLTPAQHFLDMMEKYKELRRFVHKRINENLNSIMDLIMEITSGSMDERLINYLIEKSENNGLKRTHKQIASDLGTSREVVSRLLEQFEKQGMVALSRGNIQLKDKIMN